jgi:hypothetical protein
MMQSELLHFMRVYYRMANKRKGDLISLIMIFVGVVVFVPLAIKYLNSLFGNVVSGFQNMGLAGQGNTNPLVMTCRSPNPATGEVCPEGKFCEASSNTCVTTGYRGNGAANAVGYMS